MRNWRFITSVLLLVNAHAMNKRFFKTWANTHGMINRLFKIWANAHAMINCSFEPWAYSHGMINCLFGLWANAHCDWKQNADDKLSHALTIYKLLMLGYDYVM